MTAVGSTDYGRGQMAVLRAAAHRRLILHEDAGDLPTSSRFILYELRQHEPEALFGHKSRANGRSEDQNLSGAITWLREHGHVPWDWISDETRELTTYMYRATVAEFVMDSVDDARLDLWDGEPPPLLLCESRTFGGVIERALARAYLCMVAATNGQCGGFLRTEIAPVLAPGHRILYVGDLDRRGKAIEANTRRVLEAEVGDLDWSRVALTDEQVTAYDLPVVQKFDKGYGGSFPAVEVESLGQGVVTGLVREAIEALLPEPLDDVLDRQARHKARVRRVLRTLRHNLAEDDKGEGDDR